MARMNRRQIEQSNTLVRNLFARVEKDLGVIPNMFHYMANSTRAFDGFLKMKASLASGKLSARQLQLIAVATAQFNECSYCLAANTKMGRDKGLFSDPESLQARRFSAADPKENALLQFAKRVLETRGEVSSEDLETLRDHGFEDAAMVEILASIVLNTFTNYISNLAHPVLDFPPVSAL